MAKSKKNRTLLLLGAAIVLVGLVGAAVYRTHMFVHSIFRGPPPTDQVFIEQFRAHRGLFDKIEAATRPMTLPPPSEVEMASRTCSYSTSNGEGLACEDPRDATPENIALRRNITAALESERIYFGQVRDDGSPHERIEIVTFVSGMVIAWHEKGFVYVDNPKSLRGGNDYHSLIVDSTDDVDPNANPQELSGSVYRQIEDNWYIKFSGGT